MPADTTIVSMRSDTAEMPAARRDAQREQPADSRSWVPTPATCNAGDIAHHHVMSVESPRREFAYDTDGKQAAASRLRVFDMLASGRIPAVTYHFPWPGLGHIGKQGDGFRYYPAPLRTVL